MLLKKVDKKRSKFATCLARRKRWWQRETRSWKKKTRFPTLCFCPPGSLLAFQFDLLKKRTLFYERFTQWCPSCLHYTVLLPSRALLAFQFYLSDGRLTDDGNIVITLKIARLRNALWRAILRRAILSMSFIRIARPIYIFFVLICPSNSPMCCLE